MTDQLDPQSADGRHALAVRHLLDLAKSADFEVEFIDRPPPNIRIFLAADRSCRYMACTIGQAMAFIGGCKDGATREGGSNRIVRDANRVIRGGCFGGTARGCRAACRSDWRPVGRDDDLGFRPVAEVKKGVRVIRGGYFWSSARRCRATFRCDWHPGEHYFNLGFRPVAEAEC